MKNIISHEKKAPENDNENLEKSKIPKSAKIIPKASHIDLGRSQASNGTKKHRKYIPGNMEGSFKLKCINERRAQPH